MNLQSHIKPELWSAIESTYQAENYSHAILDAMHYLSDVLREKSGSDGDGQKLVSDVMNGENPKLRINKFQTQSEKDEQKGIAQILVGLYMGIRNPRSHEQTQDSQSIADSIVYFLNYLLGIIDQASEPFTIEKFLGSAFDTDFVASDYYADLLVAEIPERKRFDTLIEIYRSRTRGNGNNLKYLVNAILRKIKLEEENSFIQIISDDFMVISSTEEIRASLQIIPVNFWLRLREISRLRIENRIIKSIEEGGKHTILKNTLWSTELWSDLGTWSRDFLPYFKLRQQVANVFVAKLQGNEDAQNYVAKYFFSVLPQVITAESQINQVVSSIVKSVVTGNTQVRESLVKWMYVFTDEWETSLVQKSIDFTDENDPLIYTNTGIPLLNNIPVPPPPDSLGDVPF